MEQLKFNFSEVDEIDQDDLEAAAEMFDDIKDNPSKYFTKPADREKIIKTLEKSGDSLIKQAGKINGEVSGAWTRKRQAQADSSMKKKDRLFEWARIFNELILLWKKNEVPEILSKIRNASDLDTILFSGYPMPPDDECPIGGWYREEYPKRKKKADKLGITSKEVCEEIRELLKSFGKEHLTEGQKRERELKVKLAKVHSFNIPGFFPTPNILIDKMLDYAELNDHMLVLEPSAGIGSILDRIKFFDYKCPLFCVERQSSLVEILNLKGYNVTYSDIFDYECGQRYDRILMNPPFENGQDIDHVRLCFDKHLTSGGRLVSIMSESVRSNRSRSKYIDFQNWVEEHNGYFIDNGQAFKDAFNSTGVSSVILVIDKHE